MKKTLLFVVPALCAAAGFAAAWTLKGPSASGVVSLEKAVEKKTDWGGLRISHEGETYACKDVLSAHVTVNPGQWPHPEHQHAEEEFCVLVEGEGVWLLNGKEYPAKKGDVFYVAPWDMHTMKNTGTKPFVFYVAKWNGKGVAAPEKK
ncbi:MAG TPA: cupin domain-containing protein [Planctomycetota bacterium]